MLTLLWQSKKKCVFHSWQIICHTFFTMWESSSDLIYELNLKNKYKLFGSESCFNKRNNFHYLSIAINFCDWLWTTKKDQFLLVALIHQNTNWMTKIILKKIHTTQKRDTIYYYFYWTILIYARKNNSIHANIRV